MQNPQIREADLARDMKILVIYFSFTSTVHTLATAIRLELERENRVTMARIEPRKPRRYWGWLARSLVPGWSVPIRPTITDLEPYDLVCLGFPKWTWNCPPITQYLREMKGCQGKNLALFMSHRGFNQERYLQNMITRLYRKGVHISDVLSIKQDRVREDRYREAVRSFCLRIGARGRNSFSVE